MELVKHHNDINKIRLGTLTEKELDIFITLIWRMQEEDTRTVNIRFSELKDLIEATVRNNDRLIKSINSMATKLIALNSKVEENGVTTHFNLFDMLRVDGNNSEVTIKITETFKYMLNNLLGNFTLYSLKEYISLNSKYSKQVFKILKQYQNLGCWYQVKLDDFKGILSIPKAYNNTANFNRYVLTPIEKELSPIFHNLKIIKLDKNNKPVGRGKKTISIRFEWDREVRQPRATLQDNIQAKEDKQRLLANQKAKKRIEKTEKLISEKTELSELDRAKGKLIAQYSKKGNFGIIAEISNLKTMEELTEFKINN